MNGRLFLVLVMLGISLSLVQTTHAQTASETVALTVRLRAPDGSPVPGELVLLESLPEEEAMLPECKTDVQGACTWYVERGLYQIRFDRPLDDVSALALAEGGLRGFGLTVGDADISYYFIVQPDDRVYFDVAPEAAVPSPYIPTLDELHGNTPAATIEATPSLEPETTASASTRADEEQGRATTQAKEGRPDRWRLSLIIGLGLALGGGLHLWSRRRQRALATHKAASRDVREDPDA